MDMNDIAHKGWYNPNGNIEQILNVFNNCVSALILMGPITRTQLVAYLEKAYVTPIGVSTNEDVTWTYKKTWNKNYISSMLKFGMLKMKGEYIDLTPAGHQLYHGDITPQQFFTRQLIEYQYHNPFLKNAQKTNIFPYWILLKLLNSLTTLNYYEAVYIILKIDNWDDKVLEDTIGKIKKLRDLKLNYNLDDEDEKKEFLEKLVNDFGPEVNRDKKWQYERNHLLWTSFCEPGDNKEIKLKSGIHEMQLNEVLSESPTYRHFEDKEEYSKYVGRKFVDVTKYYYLKEDLGVMVDLKSHDVIIDLEVTGSDYCVEKGDLLLIALKKDDYNIKSIWKVLSVEAETDKVKLSCYRQQELEKDIPFQEVENHLDKLN